MFNSQITKTISTFPQDILKKEALSDIRGSSLTYMNILDAVSDSSDFFNGLDIKRSTRIAVISHEEIDLALLFLVVSEKAVHVPLNHDFSKDEFSFYYDLLNIEYLLVEESY
jgi:long-subunit acyl-CoA synthetase (AMP-forming)